MRTLLTAAACCLLLTACVDSPAPKAAPSSVPSSSPSPAAGPSSSPKPKPKPKPKPTAKDGTNFKACLDARCQVLLKKEVEFAPAGKFGILQIHLTHKNPNRLEFFVVRRDINEVQGYLGGTGYLSLSGSLTIHVEHHDRGGAILRFEPKAKSRKSDTLSASDGGSVYG